MNDHNDKLFAVTPELFSSLAYKLLDIVKTNEKKYDGILCPLRGGFYLSYFMGKHLNLPITYIEISSYSDREQGEFKINYMPEIPHGKFLLCDDIFDSGNTIKKIFSIYPQVELDAVCLVSKDPAPRGVVYAALVEKNVWVDFFWETM